MSERMTPKRYEGHACKVCGNCVRYRSNGNCVACLRRRVAATGASVRSKDKTKREVLAHYGGVCACCGEGHPVFLTLDHIAQDGARHRTECRFAKAGGMRFYYHLKREGYPAGYRVLCFNCNYATWLLGSCPHHGEASR